MPAPLFNPHALTLDASRSWVGYAALVRGLGVNAPVAGECAVADGHIRGSVRAEADIRIFDQRYRPTDDIAGHLQFVLEHETLDLLVLSRVFRHVGTEAITAGGEPGSAPYFPTNFPLNDLAVRVAAERRNKSNNIQLIVYKQTLKSNNKLT